MLHERRREVHARVVRAMETLYADRLGEQIERLAHHALQGELQEKAVRYLRQAGVKAAGHFALSGAREHFEQALSALNTLPESQESLEQSFEIRLELRPVLRQLGEGRQMLEHLREAEAISERLNDDLRRGWVCAFMTTVLSTFDELDEALAIGNRALDIARRFGDRKLHIVSTSYLVQAHYYRGDYEQGSELATDDLAVLPDHWTHEYFGMAVPASIFDRAYLIMSLGEIGKFAEAEKYEAEAIQLVEATQHTYAVAWACFAASMLHLDKGDWANACSQIDKWFAALPSGNIQLPWAIASLAWALAQIGEASRALKLVGEGEQLLEESSWRGVSAPMVAGRTTRWVVPVCCLAGSMMRGAWAIARLKSTQRQPGFAAHALHLLGDIAAHPGWFDAESSTNHYRRALTLAQTHGMRPLVAHCHLGLGTVCRAVGEPERAREHLTTAATMYGEMGMGFWRDQATIGLSEFWTCTACGRHPRDRPLMEACASLGFYEITVPKPKPSVPFTSLAHILKHHAERNPDASAILAPGRAPLTYSRLYQHVDKVGNTLRAMGLGRHDRVAVVLPNGPDLAVAVLAVAASATCAPMNPAYGAEELGRYVADLRPRALITQVDSPARRVALSRGVQVVELSSIEAEAGLFTLTSDHGSAPPCETVGPNDVALLMLTSGTTSRPKIVRLTHANICTSACSWGPTLALTKTDRCLNMMPLFLGHGLIATVMASLAAGASVVCTPGYDIKSFFGWLTAFRPTWYSAVPTIHQAILAEARRHRERAADHRLRFVRSGAARMPPHIFAELEQTFATPVIEFCGITETAASPVACNPLPPRPRKVGSIGVPVELDVAIMDDGGALLPGGQTGQVVVRGASVTSGYDGDPVATRAAFAGGWFKTGDQGFFDDDGYLFLVGRTKEIINRGGEKVAPTEVDAVLLEHPSVVEAATFALPHPTLGEDVAAAIVLHPDAVVTPKDVRQFAMGRIAAFKVPRQVVIVAEIPKGPTGKVQRGGLAAKLGLTTSSAVARDFVAPRTPLENALAKSWAEILQIEQIGVYDDFFASGGEVSPGHSRPLRHLRADAT